MQLEFSGLTKANQDASKLIISKVRNSFFEIFLALKADCNQTVKIKLATEAIVDAFNQWEAAKSDLKCFDFESADLLTLHSESDPDNFKVIQLQRRN